MIGFQLIEEGEEIMKEAREVITTEQLLYRKREEVVEAYNRFVKRIETKDMSPERKEKLIGPRRDIIALISEVANIKHTNK